MSSPLPVISSVVEISLRLAACAKRRIYEISPLTPLGRDGKKKTVEMTKKTEANADFRISIVVLNVYLISQFSLFGEDLANKGID